MTSEFKGSIKLLSKAKIMSNLTIQQYCQLESLKTDLNLKSSYNFQEQFQGNLTVIKITDSEGNMLQELIIVL
ncbi:hypothetical protein C7B62_09695 [Pleurocapsa sp. CCALA 161]|nr:hypothetical protein C7B62_09695 [Pleurocapsa sp. CCALA 161]